MSNIWLPLYPDGGFPWSDLCKDFACRSVDRVQNGVETLRLQKVSTAWVACMNVANRQMTDGLAIASTRMWLRYSRIKTHLIPAEWSQWDKAQSLTVCKDCSCKCMHFSTTQCIWNSFTNLSSFPPDKSWYRCCLLKGMGWNMVENVDKTIIWNKVLGICHTAYKLTKITENW